VELLRSSVHRLGYHQRRCGYVNPVTEQVDDFLSKYSPEIATLGRAARRTMRQILPGWSEFIYDNYNYYHYYNYNSFIMWAKSSNL